MLSSYCRVHFLYHLLASLILLGSLIKEIFRIKPEILNGSEKNLTYKNLIRFDSLNAARDFIIENEVESVLRESHSEQFNWLEKKLSML